MLRVLFIGTNSIPDTVIEKGCFVIWHNEGGLTDGALATVPERLTP